MKKLIVFILMFLMFVNVNALEIEKVYVDTEVEIAGAIKVRALIRVKDFNEELKYKVFIKDSKLDKFDGSRKSFEKSSIYNATNIDKIKVGYIESKTIFDDFYNFDEFNNNINYIENYSVENNNDNAYINIKNVTNNDDATYYIEYVITNVLVEHNDCAELYYMYFNNFGYNIKDIKILMRLVSIPDVFEVWSHGSNGWRVSKDNTAGFVLLERQGFKKDDYIDLRVIFNKDLFAININNNKKSKVDAIEIIKQIESEKLQETKIKNILFISLTSVLTILLILVIAFVCYKKYFKKL